MRTGMVALAAGLLLLRFLPALPDARWLIGLVLVGLLSLACRRYRVAMLLLGLSWACVSAQSALDDRLAPELDDRTLWLEGREPGLYDSTLRTGGGGVAPRAAAAADAPGLVRRP